MTDGMDEVMAAVDDYRSACEAVPLQSPGYKRAEQQWEADMASTRKAVEQAVARYVEAQTERLIAALREAQREAYAQYVGDGYKWDRMRVIVDRALAGEQEPARSDGGTE